MVGKPTATEYLEAALKGAGLRQAAIANNIANLNSPGYRRSAVAFERQLAEAIEAGRSVDPKELLESIIRPKNTPVDSHGNDVALEVEIGDLIKNSAMRKTYLRVLGSLYRQMELAMQVK